ncbi:MAG: hypothetical protein HRT88_16855, partial [Lentisphaeraceae bacterium]|nr:hypothetical protein [Lentisphaeraceae bacterium]
CFDNDNVVHVEGRVDPASDIETINMELNLADLERCEKSIERLQKKARSGDKQLLLFLTFSRKWQLTSSKTSHCVFSN